MIETHVSSFVVRFVHTTEPTDLPACPEWQGLIRHVQTNEELRFTHIEEALRFMAQFVELGRENTSPE